MKEIYLMGRGRKGLFILLFFLAGAMSLMANGGPEKDINAPRGVALRGYDALAYFTEEKAVLGSPAISYQWQEATWHFSSQENRDLFVADPERYAPQFGGYCAWAVSQGSLADADPEQWIILEGKLYVNYNRNIHQRFLRDQENLSEKAHEQWAQWLAEREG